MTHAYTAEGKPQHFQTTKTGVNKGKLRPTTIRDIKKLNLRASVTGITGVMDTGGGLANWMAKEAVSKFGVKVYEYLKPIEDGDYDGNTNGMCDYLTSNLGIDPEYKERDYAAEGSVIHDKIETWIKLGMGETECPYCLAAKEIFEKYGITNPIAEATFATEDYGGAVDVYDKEQDIIIDWKTKDGNLLETKGKKFIYLTHAMQLYAYREGLGLTKNARLVNVFLSRTDAGTWCDYEHSPKEITKGGKLFELCLQLFKVKNDVE
ncbi:MAG: hypothetical protein GQ474_07960 [Sulfurimonas sp.]|nr:hypothetical protein [Sulfurimonas sp.]